MENNENEEPVLLKEEEEKKLDVPGILKECVKIPMKDLNFIFLVILTSTPFLCFLLFFEPLLYRSLLKFSNTFLFSYHYASWGYPAGPGVISYSTGPGVISYGLSKRLIHLFLLYLFPYTLLELLSMVVTFEAAASVLHKEEKNPVGLKETVRKRILCLMRAPLVTSGFVVFFSTCVVVGLVGIVGNCFVLLNLVDYHYLYRSRHVFDLVIVIFHGGVFVGVLIKYLEWSALWNMSLLISVLEGEAGFEAFEAADYYGKGSSRRGFWLMLVFFVWQLGLRLPCLLGWWTWDVADGAKGMVFGIVYVGLILVGNVFKWVSCVVFFLDCKKQVLEKKTDSKV